MMHWLFVVHVSRVVSHRSIRNLVWTEASRGASQTASVKQTRVYVPSAFLDLFQVRKIPDPSAEAVKTNTDQQHKSG